MTLIAADRKVGSPRKPLSWSGVLRARGPRFLEWLEQNKILALKFDILAQGLSQLLQEAIDTPGKAIHVWAAAPAVLSRCNDQKTYALPHAPLAYAWLHLLERYGRTWMALQQLVRLGCLPIAKNGVNVLDVGAGPGPSAFAIHDFYSALTEYGTERSIGRLIQPPSVTCVELNDSTNFLRNLLAEVASANAARHGLFPFGRCYSDFEEIQPKEERRIRRNTLLSDVVLDWDPIVGDYVYEPEYTNGQANDIAQSLHRYRLIVFSNFLTTRGTVEKFEARLADIFGDAGAGCVILMLGANNNEYRVIYERVDDLAKKAGFQICLRDVKVPTVGNEITERTFEEGRQVYQHLQQLSPNDADESRCINKYFTGVRGRF